MNTTTLRHKPYLGVQMEGPIARWYATNTGSDQRRFLATAERIAAELPAGAAVLEVAPGPGYLAIDLARRGYRVTGLDISHSFVRIASDNARRAGVQVDFNHGDVARMPFAADSFDYLVCMAAFKNFPDPVAALDEMRRVLRPGGQAAILDMRKDASNADIEREVNSMNLSAFNTWLTKLIFRHGLLRAAHTRQVLEGFVARSSFAHGDFSVDGVGYELKLRKSATASQPALNAEFTTD